MKPALETRTLRRRGVAAALERPLRPLLCLPLLLAWPHAAAHSAEADASAARVGPLEQGVDTVVADEADAEPPASDDRVMVAYREYRERVEADQLADALGPAKRAYDYAQQDLGVDDDLLARTAAALGSLLLALDRPLDALRPLTHARELYDHQRGESSGRSRTMQRKVAEANKSLGRYETAERAYLDLIARSKKVEGDVTAELAAVYSRLQMLVEEAGAHPRARRYGLEAMRLYKQARGPESLPVGFISIRLARGALEAGDWDEAFDLLDFGVPIVEKRLERGDPQLTKIYEFLVELYETAGDSTRERRYRVRLKKNRAKQAEFARGADARES